MSDGGLTPRVQAKDIAYDYGLYGVQNPTADLPHDYAERIWRQYEPQLPDAAKALETDTYAPQHWLTILKHIQAVWIRNPGFQDDVANNLATDGNSAPVGDDIERVRLNTYQALPEEVLAAARFALLRRGEGVPRVPRFILDNRGFVPLRDAEAGQSGVLFPLTGNVAVLMAYSTAQPGDDHTTGPFAVRMLSSGGAEALHAATWNHVGIEFVIGHPDDVELIARLDDAPDALLPRFGPYRGTADMVFDWALRPSLLGQRPPG
jgi:hypothetical protein